MSGEGDFIALMRKLATNSAARGLADDAAVLETGGQHLVLTHDMLAEGVHYLASDPPESVAWKLVAVNMSDLAAKGARPLGVLLGFVLAGDGEWEQRFADGLRDALAHFQVPLLGGDTISVPKGTARALGLSAIGLAPASGAPSRSGARVGDLLFVSGSIGDAGAGLALLQGALKTSDAEREALVTAYREPRPNLELGQKLAPFVTAMADISDGLLIDSDRIARASGCAIHIDLDSVPLSPAYLVALGDSADSRLSAVTAGDDYRLVFTLNPSQRRAVEAIAQGLGLVIYVVGRCSGGNAGVVLIREGQQITLPRRLGYEHKDFSG